MGFPLFVLPKRRSGQFSLMPWEQGGRLFPGRTDRSVSQSAWLRPARLPRRAPPRPDQPVVCPGFGLGKSV